MNAAYEIRRGKNAKVIDGIGVLGLASCSPAQSPENDLIHQAEQNTRESLKDPDAAQFRGMLASTEGQCVVGEILPKNGFGAYSGWQPFVWTYNRAYLSTDNPDDFPFQDARCRSQISPPKDQPGLTSADAALIDAAYLAVKKKLGGAEFGIKSVTANAKSKCVTMQYVTSGNADYNQFVSVDGKEISVDKQFREAISASTKCIAAYRKVVEAML